MTLRVDRPWQERLGVAVVASDAMEYARKGWDAPAWLTLCCMRIDRERRGASPNSRAERHERELHALTRAHQQELATIATFAFHPHTDRS